MSWLQNEQLLEVVRSVVGVATNWWIQSALLIAAGLGVGALCRKRGSAAQSAVYRTTLVAVIAAPLVTWGLNRAGVRGWSVEMPDAWSLGAAAPASDAVPGNAEPPDWAKIGDGALAAIRASEESTPNEKINSYPRLTDAPIGQDNSVALELQTEAQAQAPIDAAPVLTVHRFGVFAAVASAAWALVAAVLSLRLAIAWRRLGWIRRRAAPSDLSVQTACRELAARLGVAPPPVLHSPYLPSPCLMGLRHPAVLLPESTGELPLRDVLAHELAHLSRGDCYWNLLRQLAGAALFFQPLMWRLSRRLAATAEEVCDDYVVHLGGDRRIYAHRLVDIAELSLAPFAPAGVGIVSLRSMLGQRVARIMDTSRSLSTRVGGALLALVLVGGLLGTLAAGLVGLSESASAVTTSEEGAVDDVVVENDADEAASDDDVVNVRGQVVDPEGQPMPNVDVYALRWYWNFGDRKPLATTKSDADGRFEISYRKSQFAETAGRPNQWREVYIAGFANGFGPGWAHYDRLKPGEEAKVTLAVDDVPIEGRVIDLEGNPVAGATIEVGSIADPNADTLDEYIAAISARQAISTAYSTIDETLPHHSAGRWTKLTTDTDGRFRVTGVGRERLVDLHVTGPTIVTDTLRVATRRMDPIVHPAYAYENADDSTQYGAEFEYAAAPSRAIEGIVRDADTGDPVADTEVWSWKFAGHDISGITTIKTRTDVEGRYRLEGMPKGEGNQVVVVPTDAPYFTAQFDVPNPTGSEPAAMDLELHRGVWITGRVTDNATGKPVAAHLHYGAFPDNELALKLKEFQYGAHETLVQDRFRTDVEGNYRLVGLRGHGFVTLKAVIEAYPGGQGFEAFVGRVDRDAFMRLNGVFSPTEKFPTAMKEVTIDAAATETVCDFSLDPGGRLVVNVVDPDGKPAPGVLVSGTSETDGFEEPMNDATFELRHFRQGENRSVLFYAPDRKLGKALKIKLDDGRNGPVTVRLEPVATVLGQLTNDGHPLPGIDLEIYVSGDEGFSRQLRHVATDAEGKFRHESFLPGLSYDVLAEGAGIEFKQVAKALKVQAGETVDLGTIDIALDERTEPMRSGGDDAPAKSAVASPKAKQKHIAGRVVGPDGKPVADADVAVTAMRIVPRRGGDLSPNGDVLAGAKTDADGAFEMSLVGSSTKTHQYPMLIVRSAGAALGWRMVDLEAPATDATIELQPEVPVVLRLVDIEGQPAAGTCVTVTAVTQRSLLAGQIGSDSAGFRGERLPAAWIPPLTADAAGRLEIPHLAANYGTSLQVAGDERVAPQEIAVNTGMPEQRGERDATYRPLVVNNVGGNGATSVPLAPAQLFTGTVTYEDTGEPAPHARLTIWASQQEMGGSMSSVAGEADEKGRFRISPNSGIRFGINAYPQEGAPYLVRSVEPIAWRGGDKSREVNVKLPRGVLVRGRVVERGTKEPIGGASVQYVPEQANNPHARDDVVTGWQGMLATDDAGNFQMAVLPGPGRILVHGPNGDFVLHETSGQELFRGTAGGARNYASAIERIDPEPDAEPLELTIAIDRGQTVRGELVDTTGAPVDQAVMVTRLTIRSFWLSWHGQPVDVVGGHFEVGGLHADQETPVHFLDPRRKLGATLMARAGIEPPRVVLQPCGKATMRFVDDNGQPVDGYEPNFQFVVTPGVHEFSKMAREAGVLAADADFLANVDRLNHGGYRKTGADGKYVLAALIPGATYRLVGYRDGEFSVAKDFVAEAGKSLDLGDIVVQPQER